MFSRLSQVSHIAVLSMALLVLSVAVTGCKFDRSGIPLDDGFGNGDASSGLNDPPDATVPDAPPPPELIDDGLLVRYYMDEADSGQAPMKLDDSALNPLPLDIHYDEESESVMSFTEVGGNRGLTWTAVTSTFKGPPGIGESLSMSSMDRASAALIGSKLLSPNALYEAKTATIEVVVDMYVPNADGWKILDIGTISSDAPNAFTLRSRSSSGDGVNLLVFSINGQSKGLSDLGLSTQVPTGRMVLHAVFDSEALPKSDTVLLYRNGERVAPVENFVQGVDPGTTLTLPADSYLVLGNNENGGSNFQGTIFYAALYSTALSEDTIQNNVARLLVDDDRPAPSTMAK